MTATGSGNAVPTDAWGRPARLQPPPEVVDLRDGPASHPLVDDRPPGFSPTPPPPAPPGAPPPARRRATPHGRLHDRPRYRVLDWLRYQPAGRLRTALELAVAVLLLAGLAAAVRPAAPAPLTPEDRWEVRSAPGVGALARDLASVNGATSWSPALASRLRADLARAEAAGPPPDPRRAVAWNEAIHRVGAALSEGGSHPEAARSELLTAGLELTALSGSATSA